MAVQVRRGLVHRASGKTAIVPRPDATSGLTPATPTRHNLILRSDVHPERLRHNIGR